MLECGKSRQVQIHVQAHHVWARWRVQRLTFKHIICVRTAVQSQLHTRTRPAAHCYQQQGRTAPHCVIEDLLSVYWRQTGTRTLKGKYSCSRADALPSVSLYLPLVLHVLPAQENRELKHVPLLPPPPFQTTQPEQKRDKLAKNGIMLGVKMLSFEQCRTTSQVVVHVVKNRIK